MEDEALSQNVEFFFAKPSSKDECVDFSRLYLLRKHVNICFGIDPVQPEAIWPGAMAILSGIDMLSLYYTGGRKIEVNDGEIESYITDRFTFMRFCENFFKLDKNSAETIYIFRNALLHTFGLVSINEIKKNEDKTLNENYGKEYIFTGYYDKRLPWLIQQTVDESNDKIFHININLYQLLIQFESAIDKYRCQVETDPDTGEKFQKMFTLMGFISVKQFIINS